MHLLSTNDTSDEGYWVLFVGCFDGDLVDVFNELFAVEGSCGITVAVIVSSLVWWHEPILKIKLIKTIETINSRTVLCRIK